MRNSKPKPAEPDIADVFLQMHNSDGRWDLERMVFRCKSTLQDAVCRKLPNDLQKRWNLTVARIGPLRRPWPELANGLLKKYISDVGRVQWELVAKDFGCSKNLIKTLERRKKTFLSENKAATLMNSPWPVLAERFQQQTKHGQVKWKQVQAVEALTDAQVLTLKQKKEYYIKGVLMKLKYIF